MSGTDLLNPREAELEDRLSRLVGKCRGARTPADNRKALKALVACIATIDREGFNGVGIRTVRQDIAWRGLHQQSWWQTFERGGELLKARQAVKVTPRKFTHCWGCVARSVCAWPNDCPRCAEMAA